MAEHCESHSDTENSSASHYGSSDSCASGVSDTCSDKIVGAGPGDTCFSKTRYFSVKQRAILNGYYKCGMRGVGQQYDVLMEHASRESGLSHNQVEVSPKQYNTIIAKNLAMRVKVM